MDEQKNIEQYFEEHGITDPDLKVKILPEVTNLIYERNNALVKAERTDEEDIKQGLKKEAQETEEVIQETIKDTLKRLKK